MSYQQYRPSGYGFLPPVIKNLLIINGLFFLATIIFASKFHIDLADKLGLHYFFSEKFRPYQLVTYLFMHADIRHIGSNMLSLWLFGAALEMVWGSKRFLSYYLICGIGAALLHYVVFYFEIQPVMTVLNDYIANPSAAKFEEIVSTDIKLLAPDVLQKVITDFKLQYLGDSEGAIRSSVEFIEEYKKAFLNLPNVIGASGSVFGLLLGAGMMFPNAVMFPIPIKVKIFVILYGAAELFAVINPMANDDIAHYAHLGGMLFGYILIKYWGLDRHRFN